MAAGTENNEAGLRHDPLLTLTRPPVYNTKRAVPPKPP
jgi:hypothetical protein